MRHARDIMGMPVQVEIAGSPIDAEQSAEAVFDFFRAVDQRFSTYKDGSEISRINRGELPEREWSNEMREIFTLAEETRIETDGYFDIRRPDGVIDPSGLVKGWAIQKAADLLRSRGHQHFYLDVGGDIQTSGTRSDGSPWRLGIRNPLKTDEIVQVITPGESGVATSGTYLRGTHIYDPLRSTAAPSPYLSLTVIGPNIYEADRFATAAFAMGERALPFLESLPGFEAYGIRADGIATMTSGFSRYVETH